MATVTVTLPQVLPLLQQLSLDDTLALYQGMHKKMPDLKSPKYVVYHLSDALRLDSEETLSLMWNTMLDRGVTADLLCVLYEDEDEDQVVFNVHRAAPNKRTGPLIEHPEARMVLAALRKTMVIDSGLVVQLNDMCEASRLVPIIKRCLNVSVCEVNRYETERVHVVVGNRIVAVTSLSIETAP